MLVVSVEAALSMCRTSGGYMRVDMLDGRVWATMCVCVRRKASRVYCLVDVVRDMVVYLSLIHI